MANRKRSTPTIRDVAKLAGVSQSTASRALTQRGYTSQEVRERVLQAANALGYKPHGVDLPHLGAVYFDPYQECRNERHEIHGIDFLVRPLTKGNHNRSQLCQPETYQEPGDDFSSCELTSIVAWDHVSWPGNDYYLSARITDDGVKAAATDSMYGMTGIQGSYDPISNQYCPPADIKDWNAVVLQKGIQLSVQNKLIIYP